MLVGLIIFLATRKKYLGIAGSYVPNPLSPEEKKSVFLKFGISAIVIVIVGAILISNGILTIDGFIMLVSILGIIIPIIYFLVMYFSKKNNKSGTKEFTCLYSIIPCSNGVLGNPGARGSYPGTIR